MKVIILLLALAGCDNSGSSSDASVDGADADPPDANPPDANPPDTLQCSTSQFLETSDVGDAFLPQVAIDLSGNATVVWQQADASGRNSVWVNRLVSTSGWGTATEIETDAGDALSPQIAVDPAGNVTVVWDQRDASVIRGGGPNIWANRFASGSGWGAATLIEANDAGSAKTPRIAVDPAGNATVVWEQHDGVGEGLWANRFAPGTSWGTATPVGPNNTYPNHVDVAVDEAGNVTAVSIQAASAGDEIRANRFVPGIGWGTGTDTLVGPNVLNATVQIAVNASGTVTAVWSPWSPSAPGIGVIRWLPGSGWGSPTLLATEDHNAYGVQIAVDPSGNAIAIWTQSDGDVFCCRNVWASRFVVGVGWEPATLVETDDTGNAGRPQIAIDPDGNATAIWFVGNDSGTRYEVWANRFIPDSGWGTPRLLENASGLSPPQVAVDSSGNAVAVWDQWNGVHNSIKATTCGPPE